MIQKLSNSKMNGRVKNGSPFGTFYTPVGTGAFSSNEENGKRKLTFRMVGSFLFVLPLL